MAIDKKVEALEGEVKLMKGELKETLTNVRDFLLSLKLPPPQVEGLEGEASSLDINAGLSLNTGSSISLQSPKGSVEIVQERPVTQQVESDRPAVSSVARTPSRARLREVEASPQAVVVEPTPSPAEARAPAQFVEVEESTQSAASEPSEPPGQRKRLEESEVVRAVERKGEEEMAEPVTGLVAGATPQVNLLPNLLRWVAVATREIGIEQLPGFLDVYATTGNLSPEIRGVILCFAGVVEEQPSDAHTACVYSRLMSEQLATFLEMHSVNGYLSPEVKEGIMRFASVMAKQASTANTASVWNQLMGEQLATFLEVHSANGQLSPEVKEGVLRFISAMAPQPPIGNKEADVTPQSAERNVADVWSQLILELHGILTGGGALLKALSQFQDGVGNKAEAAEIKAGEGSVEALKRLGKDEPVKPAEEKPVTLKLVLPASGGVEKEFSIGKFSINITTEAGGDDS